MISNKADLPILLAIDPSVRNLGWCCVNLNNAVGGDYYDLENEEYGTMD